MTPIWSLVWLFGSFILLCVGAFMLGSWAGLLIAIGAWGSLGMATEAITKTIQSN